jgi:hypothetical protein
MPRSSPLPSSRSCVWFLAASLMALSGGCSHAPVRVDYLVEGRVVDASDGAPLPGVKVHTHWPSRMPTRPDAPRNVWVTTDREGRYQVVHPVWRPAEHNCMGGLLSVDEGDADGTALTVQCSGCQTTSAGIGESTMDFLSRHPNGGIQVVRRVPRPPKLVEPRPDGLVLVEYALPDIPVPRSSSSPSPDSVP